MFQSTSTMALYAVSLSKVKQNALTDGYGDPSESGDRVKKSAAVEVAFMRYLLSRLPATGVLQPVDASLPAEGSARSWSAAEHTRTDTRRNS